MTFDNILKKSFLDNFSDGLNNGSILLVLLITFLLGIYIFGIYRLVCRNEFYSREFNMSLVAVSLITAAIILTIQSSIVISLGMVGALSIVRFRTAIKKTIDLVFLFWGISIGITCGAGLFRIAIISTIFLTACICGLSGLPLRATYKVLIINAKYPYEGKW